MEKIKNTFTCNHCHKVVEITDYMGTSYRNHCPFCLWSTHVDWKSPGDRNAKCGALMEPIGLTFKKETIDKYGKKIQGELMVVHLCSFCGKISTNRLASDDDTGVVLELFEKTINSSEEIKEKVAGEGIKLLDKKDEEEVKTQLFGKR
ncbi:hypothetical protein COS54_00105 [Candidatus Shapirobacteria bacterium CG03_land_8_20_14_0_80_39_12]|uniref:RNHCP domain-containing protein n=1 Tax=Candidatus Shapirobacteria bacterium CG03_land_8_20_14_0_80_39_12 TaxID=1974879 RepID=A0A2M7BFZ1_9BACT|nr:MAG: hypothetical protein COS54_00105 [Candidatus Shapirobacteria bacterium CG03_land_8_20_14_0_80_39_12]